MLTREMWAERHGIPVPPPIEPHGPHPDWPPATCHKCFYPYNSVDQWLFKHVDHCTCDCGCSVDNPSLTK